MLSTFVGLCVLKLKYILPITSEKREVVKLIINITPKQDLNAKTYQL
jgi:hypothetical protein